MNAICQNCRSTFRHADRGEDGAPEVPDARKCAAEGCEVYLCRAGCTHLSFVCSGCTGRFCDAHASFRLGRETLCGGCYFEVIHITSLELPEVA